MVARTFAAVALAAGIANAQGYSPGEAVRRMRPAPGFRVSLTASEPEVRQPILVQFDDRGRLWTIQYLQYPNPAGLKRVTVDRYSRTTYDRVPEPPPRGPKGADRITIIEDAMSGSRATKFRDFVSGLNLATGLATGHGGVFVMQVPYLLFYPDRNRDDVPDGDPEVLLEGFGMEDAQSLANHLTWGPDGWLYGLNGSTTTCRVRGIEFQQGVWRYHPVTRKFELFAEGGGNIYGIAFDAKGNLFYSSNGASPFWHAVQGGYYQKSFGKHGPLHNPHAYGYFPHVKHDGVPGGHVVLGGLIYSGDSFPESFRESFLGGNFLGHSAAWWTVSPLGSTVQAKLGGLLFDAQDKSFCPTDLAQAPDGSIYVCDFHDTRTAHPDPDAEWDTSNGRIYRVEAEGTRRIEPFDLSKRTSAELVTMLTARNRWYADRARVILAERRDRSVWPALRQMAVRTDDANAALQGLWGLHVSGGFDDAISARLLKHPDEHVRAWTVRLLGDANRVSLSISAALRATAAAETSAVTRAQLAASAKRLPATDALPVLEGIRNRSSAADPFIPWLTWWALEDKSVRDGEFVARHMARPAAWTSAPWVDDQARLMRRWAAEGSEASYGWCARLLAAAPAEHRTTIIAALDQGLSERAGVPPPPDTGVFQRFQSERAPASAPRRKFAPVAGPLLDAIRAEWRRDASNAVALRTAIRAGIPGAMSAASADAANRALPEERRVAMLAALRDTANQSVIASLVPLLREEGKIRDGAIDALQRFDHPRVTTALLAMHDAAPARIQDLLLTRPSSTRALLDAVDRGRIPASAIPVEKLRRVAAFGISTLDTLVKKHWGTVTGGTAEEKLATVRRLNNDVRAAAGDAAKGRALYLQHCGACHKLRGEGGTLGMDLTAANRSDAYYLLTHIVDPSAFIRKEYTTAEIRARDGRLLRGLVTAEDAGAITLTDAQLRSTRVNTADIASRADSPVSVMPEGILEKLSPQQLRDLFAWLRQ